jgi:hypothetical protein
MSATTAWETERKPPPPMPWSNRAPISCAMVCDSAHKTEATTNSVIEISSSRRRP